MTGRSSGRRGCSRTDRIPSVMPGFSHSLSGRVAWIAALPAFGAVAAADVIYVDVSATGSSDGSSWADAYTSLQAAIGAAASGDEIWVARGTYRPGPPPSEGGARDAAFVLHSGVAIYGGFAGSESTRDQRDRETNPTILSGDLAANDGPDFTASEENSFQVVVAVDTDSNTILDGFVITAGRADGPGFGATPASKEQGSGINIYFGAPRIANCTITGNWSLNHGAVNDHGLESAFTNCRFIANYSASFGAGLYLHHDAAALVEGCLFQSNVSAREGAGFYSRSMHGAMVHDCDFFANEAQLGAGAYVAIEGTTHFSECTFTDNVAATGGGGIYADFASPTIDRCTFAGNRAGVGLTGGGGGGGGSGGGGIWTEGGSPVITACTFIANVASLGGGSYHIHDSLALVSDCTYLNNQANEAGGLYTLVSAVTMTGCTFIGNSASDGAFPVGGGVSTYFSNSITRDCIFIGNSAELGGGGVYTEGESPVVSGCVFHANTATGAAGWGGGLLNSFFAASTVVNCTFTANSAIVGGAANNQLGSTPRFVNCTLIGNEATDAGGGVWSHESSNPLIISCILTANAPTQVDGAAGDVRYSLVDGGHAGPGNLDMPPRLVRLPDPGADGVWRTSDDDLGDLRPRPGSPCIDAGDSSALPAGYVLDLGGSPRRVDDVGMPDIGPGPAPVIDLGAYEFQGVSCRADFDESGMVNSADFFSYLGAFFASPADPAADFDRDGGISSADFFDFLAAFFAGCS
jgi:predicted outer membrane repeat protein